MDKEKARAWFQGWMVTKGGAYSGNYMHTSHSRHGQTGGSDPGGGHSSLGIGGGASGDEKGQAIGAYREGRDVDLSGGGAFGNDGTATEKQAAYAKALLTGDDVSVEAILSGKQQANVMPRQASFVVFNTACDIKVAPPIKRKAFSADQQVEIGSAFTRAAVKWGHSLDTKGLSKSGCSSLIDSAKGGLGVVNAFIRAHGGSTLQSRAALINRISKVKVKIVQIKTPKGAIRTGIAPRDTGE